MDHEDEVIFALITRLFENAQDAGIALTPAHALSIVASELGALATGLTKMTHAGT